MARDFVLVLQQNLFYSEGQLDPTRVTIAACLFVLLLIAMYLRIQRFAAERDQLWRESGQRQGRAIASRAVSRWPN